MKRILIIAAGASALATAGAAHAQRIPKGHLPTAGECRVWYPDRPAGQQPPPSSCREAERRADRYGGRVIYGRHRGSDEGRGAYDRRDRHEPGDDDFRGEQITRYDDLRSFTSWAIRNFDYNGDGRLSRREYDRAAYAYRRR
jgi:hypothetical protein